MQCSSEEESESVGLSLWEYVCAEGGRWISHCSEHVLLISNREVLCARWGDAKLSKRISFIMVVAFAWMLFWQKYCCGFINYVCPKGRTGKTSFCPRSSVCHGKMDWLLFLT